ncbi:MAG: acetoin utilization protein AcuC [Armatimonadetes bacterium]|nr:acetoin utilization protein AcuC [Armatimonadota bacterium]
MSSLPHFYYHPRLLEYEISPQHPLKPERLRRTIELLDRYGVVPIDPGPCRLDDVLRVHSAEFVEAVKRLDPIEENDPLSEEDRYELAWIHGFHSSDNPAFPRMYRASLAYTAATVKAAEAVRDGASLAFGIGGGLHHALREKASGFCVFNDPAIACAVLRDRFARVAYVDIDVHHGDGVQWIFYDDPSVLTISIHEDGRTLWPRTGGTEETGRLFSSFNIPLEAKTTGDVWLWAFKETAIPALRAFQPEAIVLQMGVDTHFADKLGHLNNTAQEWLEAVIAIKELGVPIVALGGGGYTITNVPRMWAAACLTLSDIPFDHAVPADLAEAWDMPRYFDPYLPTPREQGIEWAEDVVNTLIDDHLPNLVGP